MGAIYLIRHGQASFGAADYDRLSALGERQAEILGSELVDRVPGPHVVMSGTMKRHRQTAERCLEAMGQAPDYQPDEGFNEFDFGEVIVRFRPAYSNRERLRIDLARESDPERAFQELFSAAVERWLSGRHDHEYRESWAAFRGRCVAAAERLAAALDPGSSALVFTSGGPIGAIVQQLLSIPDSHIFALNWSLANCGVTKLLNGAGGLRVSTINDHGAFEGGRAGMLSYR